MMKAVSLDNSTGEEIAKALEGGNKELTCPQQVHLLARALSSCMEEFYRIAEILSVITPEHKAMPDEEIVSGAVSALYFAAPLTERQEILHDVFTNTKSVADADKEVQDA
jgi:hypothetical protein